MVFESWRFVPKAALLIGLLLTSIGAANAETVRLDAVSIVQNHLDVRLSVEDASEFRTLVVQIDDEPALEYSKIYGGRLRVPIVGRAPHRLRAVFTVQNATAPAQTIERRLDFTPKAPGAGNTLELVADSVVVTDDVTTFEVDCTSANVLWPQVDVTVGGLKFTGNGVIKITLAASAMAPIEASCSTTRSTRLVLPPREGGYPGEDQGGLLSPSGFGSGWPSPPGWPGALLLLSFGALLLRRARPSTVPKLVGAASVLILAVSCGGDGGGSGLGARFGPEGASFVMKSLGAGPESVLPLFPLHHRAASDTYVHTARRFDGYTRHTLAAGGAEYATLIESETGVFVFADMAAEQPTPVLIAPAAVRVGMRWTSILPLDWSAGRVESPSKADRWRHEIVAMLESQGRRTWLMHAVGPELLDYLGDRPGYFPQLSVAFEEGVGPLDPFLFQRPGFYELGSNEQFADIFDEAPKGELRTTHAPVPTADPINAADLIPEDLPVLQPELLNGGAAIGVRTIVEDVSIAEHPDEGVVLRWLGFGPPGFYNAGTGFGPDGEVAGQAPGFYMARTRHCATVTSPTSTVEPSQETSVWAECAHAMTSFVDASGTFHEPRNGLMGGALPALVLRGGAGYAYTTQAWALLDAPGGSLRGLSFAGADSVRQASLGLGTWAPGPVDQQLGLGAPDEQLFTHPNAFGFLDWREDRHRRGAYLIEPAGEDGLNVVFRGAAGEVFASTHMAAEFQTPAQQLGPFMGRGSASRRGDDVRLLSVSAEGLVQQIQWRGRLERHTLGVLELPPTHRPMRIVALEGNDAFVFTVVGSTAEPEYDPFNEQTPGDTYLWRVTLPDPIAAPVVDPLAELTRASVVANGRARRYCASPTLGWVRIDVEASVEGWPSLIDAECEIAIHERPEGVISGRTPNLASATYTYADYGQIEAPAPTKAGFPVEEGGITEGRCAKLPHGKICEHGVFEAFGLGLAHRHHAQQLDFADAHPVHGSGLWRITGSCDGEQTPVAEVQGRCGAECCEAAVFISEQGESIYPVRSGPTGVIVEGPDTGALFGETWQLDPDGTEQEIPRHPVRRLGFEDGLRCDPDGECVLADGTVASVDAERARVLLDFENTEILAEGLGRHGLYVTVFKTAPVSFRDQAVVFAIFDPRTEGDDGVITLGRDGFPDFFPANFADGEWRAQTAVDAAGERLFTLEFVKTPSQLTGMVLRIEGDELVEYDYPLSFKPTQRYPSSVDSGWLVHVAPELKLSELIERTRHRAESTSGCVPRAEECNGFDDDCDGLIDNDPEGRTIDETCSALNMPGRCVEGACERACVDGYLDCDATIDCETELGTELNCGGCNDRCEDGEACVDGGCECADGGRVGTDAHCGACGDACGEQAGCIEGQCVIRPDRIEVGAQAACVMRAGELICFGRSELVPSGPGLYVPPTVVEGFAEVTDLAMSGGHACLVDAGRVYCWGEPTLGRTGQPAATRTPLEVVLPGAEGPAVQVAVGAVHSCALAGGDVYCWGDNSEGQLGVESPGGAEPVQTTAVGDVLQVSVGGSHSCYMRSGGAVYCFGRARNGELGADVAGGVQHRRYPVDGDELVATDALTYVRAGAIWSGSGLAAYGQLGEAAPAGRVFEPVEIPELIGASQLRIQQTHCFVGADERVHCGGLNGEGELGDGTVGPPNQDLPDVVHDALGPVRALGGYSIQRPSFCAITQADRVYCWGDGALHGGGPRVLEPAELRMP